MKSSRRYEPLTQGNGLNRNRDGSSTENGPQSFCLSISANMAEEELTELVVDNDSGKCKARSAGDEGPFVVNVSGKGDFASDDALVAVPSFASDDAPVAVPSSLSTLKSPSTRKRRKWRGSAFEELFIDPIMYEQRWQRAEAQYCASQPARSSVPQP